MAGSNIHYEMSDKGQGMTCGGIGAIHKLVGKLGLDREIDTQLELLKIHVPYHESDHVLTMSYNLLMGGQCIEDIERLRTNVNYMDALGALRMQDPTTSGDFLRRFKIGDVEDLMEAVNDARLQAWRAQPSRFRKQAIIDVDGTIVETTGKKKEGADFAYNGKYGYILAEPHELCTVQSVWFFSFLFVVRSSGSKQ